MDGGPSRARWLAPGVGAQAWARQSSPGCKPTVAKGGKEKQGQQDAGRESRRGAVADPAYTSRSSLGSSRIVCRAQGSHTSGAACMVEGRGQCAASLPGGYTPTVRKRWGKCAVSNVPDKVVRRHPLSRPGWQKSCDSCIPTHVMVSLASLMPPPPKCVRGTVLKRVETTRGNNMGVLWGIWRPAQLTHQSGVRGQALELRCAKCGFRY